MKLFERVACVTLARRPDRWEQFLRGLPEDWPFGDVERFVAIDGKKCPHPKWWTQRGGAWGCYQSHLALIQDCLNRGVQSVLLLEDDAVFRDDFTARWGPFAASVPDDWDLLYLGGQPWNAKHYPPEKVNDHVYRVFNVNRTHAWAVSSRGLPHVYRHLCGRDFGKNARQQHIDSHMGYLLEKGSLKAYAPPDWLADQRGGFSDVRCAQLERLTWPGMESRLAVAPQPDKPAAPPEPLGPFVAVLGLHSSGSSVLAGVIHTLGVHLGNRLFGSHTLYGYEAHGLARLCENALPFPTTRWAQPEDVVERALRTFISNRQWEAKQRNTIAGGKYPHLCAMGPLLRKVCADNLIVIHASRPLEHSIRSLQRRCAAMSADTLEKLQRWLDTEKRKFLSDCPDVLTVEYDDLLCNPEQEVARVAERLNLHPWKGLIGAACQLVDPKKQHVRS